MKAQRLEQALQDLSPTSDYSVDGSKLSVSDKEKATKENKELMEKIAKANDPAFAARALLAASKGTGTNEVLFEAVLNAGKDVEYYKKIDEYLKSLDTNINKLGNSEYFIGIDQVVDNKFYKQYRLDLISEAQGFETTDTPFVYTRGGKTYKWDFDRNIYALYKGE